MMAPRAWLSVDIFKQTSRGEPVTLLQDIQLDDAKASFKSVKMPRVQITGTDNNPNPTLYFSSCLLLGVHVETETMTATPLASIKDST